MAKGPLHNSQNDNLVIRLWRSDLGKRLVRLARLAAIVGIVVRVVAAAGLLGRQGSGESVRLLVPPPPPGAADYEVGVKVGQVAKDFDISDFRGNRIRLSDFRGRPAYLNFWTT
jgi:hypothetical protein